MTETKHKYLEFVRLTSDEFDKLIDSFGAEDTADKLAALNDYLGSKGDKYKSHYHTILCWDRRDNNKYSKKTKLWPIKDKVCGKSGCVLPAVYKSKSTYPNFYCSDHMPDKVKEKFY